jgi:polar amino acid transport system permease protein
MAIGKWRAGDQPSLRNLIWIDVVPTVLAVAILLGLIVSIKWDFVSQLDFASIWRFRVAIGQGILNTVLLTAISVALGGVIGTLAAIGSQLRYKPARWMITAYLEIFRNTPLLLQLFWIHFALPRLTGVSTSPFESGLIAMSLQSSAYLADVVRSGVEAIPRGQWEAAAALGLTKRITWVKIVLPQAFKIVIPPLANIAVGYFKSSAMLSLLSVGELMTVATRIAQYSFKPIETYTVVGIVYLVLGAIFSNLTFRLERIYSRSGSAA